MMPEIFAQVMAQQLKINANAGFQHELIDDES
jgi:hypothetical protein